MLVAILVLPQIIEARRGRVAVTTSPNVVQGQSNVTVGTSVRNDTSENLRDMKQLPIAKKASARPTRTPRFHTPNTRT